MCTYQNHPGPHSSPNQSIILCNSIFNFRTFLYLVVVVFQLLSSFRLFGTPWTAAHQSSLSFTISQSLLKLMSFVSVMPSNHLILCRPLLLPSIFPASGSFPVNQFFASDGQSTGASASASVLPMNIQDAPIKKKRNSKIQTPTTTWMSFKNIILNNNNKNRYRIMSPGNILYASLYMKCSNGQSSSMMMEIRKQLPL